MKRLRKFTTRLVLVLLVAASLPPITLYAQDDERPKPLWWDDAPIIPRYRSEADWLVDVGWRTEAEVYGPFPTHEYEVGEEEQFIPLGASDTESFFLRYRTDHAYFWFEWGTQVNEADLEAVAHFFEQHIWPLNNAIYGDEWNPGIDGDSRLHVVNQSYIQSDVVGAFNPKDQCPRFLCPQSNQREILYISLELASLNSQEYLATLAHEHQHLIQHHIDGNEKRWLNEGLSQLAEHFAGFHPRYIAGSNLREYLREPDLALDGWAEHSYDMSRYYGAGYLFLVYLYESFGLDFIRLLASSDYDGLAAVEHALVETGQGMNVDEVFADWILANYLDDPYAGSGRYYYQTLDLPVRIHPLVMDMSGGITNIIDPISQYGVDYYRVETPGRYEVFFQGRETVSITGTSPHSKEWMWWSNNHSNSAARLTGAFDLTGLTTATLVFNGWWQVEPDFDWFQVLVSRSGGRDWEIVGGPRATMDGLNAPGLYYTGQSSRWLDEQIDLTRYVGGPVLIRFEYITDSSGTMPGVVLDDIGIIELGYLDDAEGAFSVWNPEGFMRIQDTLPQNWTVVLVKDDGAGMVTVEPVALDAHKTGSAHVEVPDGGTVTIVIGAMAPFTAEQTDYNLIVQSG